MSGAEALSWLVAVEAIKVLKARYLRAMDERNWAMLHDTMTADVRFEHPSIGSHTGSANVVAAIRATVERFSLTVHHVTMPEITIVDERSASGSWALHSCVRRLASDQMAPAPLLHGYGRYHDEFRHEHGGWRIAALALTHLYKERD